MSDENNKEVLKVEVGPEGVDAINLRFPSNSNREREEKAAQPREEKRLQKVGDGKVTIQKKTLGQRFLGAFTGEDFDAIVSYIVHDILISAAKGVVSDIVKAGTDAIKDSIEAALYNGTRRDTPRVRREGDRSYVNYGGFSSNQRRDRDRDRDRDRNRDNRNRREFTASDRAYHRFENLIFDSRVRAEEILNQLVDLTIDGGAARVSDLYDLAGMPSSYTDNDYGWEDLHRASVDPVRGGYIINLPRPRPLD
jgi:hypothetical protein